MPKTQMAVDLKSFVCKRSLVANRTCYPSPESFAKPTIILRGGSHVKILIGGIPTPLKNMKVSWDYDCPLQNHRTIFEHWHMIDYDTGWWCNNHLEKYEFVNGKDDIPYMKWKIKFMFQTTNQNMTLNLSPKKTCFREVSKNFRGISCWNPGGLCNGQSLHGPLDRQWNMYTLW